MRKIAVILLILLGSCEINDVQVVDIETSAPAKDSPWILENGTFVRAVTQTATGDPVFLGLDENNTSILGMRKITGEIITREIGESAYEIGSYGSYTVLFDGNVTVYDDNLEYVDYYTADTYAFTSRYNKVTWAQGSTIYQLSLQADLQSSSLDDPGGGTVSFEPSGFFHLPNRTFAKARVDTNEATYFHMVQYDDAFRFVDDFIIDANYALLFNNASRFYLGHGLGTPTTIYEYASDGSFLREIEDFSIPDYDYAGKYQLLEDGNIMVLSNLILSILDFETREELWSLRGVQDYYLNADGSVVIATTYNSGVQGDGPNIYIIEPYN
ncbi:hypothetical protein LVD17_04945 [Fulvivirga ulvae]|uniref:hypothetical protein n=1 Tax=Fulvivirga ulvae TaxID=2904245 RepID=UPI001F405A89|nr:hypothetical protein [Fulvivirga ulvae]UII33173.1 hypothetical protein LVD17_04945 [Fulvivirga ulvae]